MRLCNTLFALLTVSAWSSVESPVAGCFLEGGYAHVVLGVGGNFILRPAEGCPDVPNEWTIEIEQDQKWLLKRDPVSGAVEHRERLHGGTYIVWPDGRLIDVGELDLPGELKSARLMSGSWYRLVLDGGTNVALARNGRWFLLPGVPR
jgi:hypothetical protein